MIEARCIKDVLAGVGTVGVEHSRTILHSVYFFNWCLLLLHHVLSDCSAEKKAKLGLVNGLGLRR